MKSLMNHAVACQCAGSFSGIGKCRSTPPLTLRRFFVITVFCCFFCFSSLCYVIEIFDFNVRYDKLLNVSTCAKTADGYRKLSISNVGLTINLKNKE